MGTLRTLFAISVVLGHTYGLVFVGGRNAVQLFYMISGFLISYVLVEKKAYNTVSSFYVNRYLRLYPIYIVVASCSLVVYSFLTFSGTNIISFNFKTYNEAPEAANILLIFSNITIFLQDWVMFSGVKHHELVFDVNFRDSNVLLYQGLFVPQAWTLGVELTFYLIAPFVLVRRKVISFLLVLSIATRIYLIKIGLATQDPWTYRFFPTELALFLLGVLAHQVLLPYYKKVLSPERMEIFAKILTTALVVITVTYWLIPIHKLIATFFLFSTFLASLPFIFVFQSKYQWDKWVGDLSYPIYICHFLMLNVVVFSLSKFGFSGDRGVSVSVITILLSIGFSMALNHYIVTPVEALRNRIRISRLFGGTSQERVDPGVVPGAP
jgi:peptidoglycan/LPS O-acetylase OafA/YrhL